jgi:hypothetical protein
MPASIQSAAASAALSSAGLGDLSGQRARQAANRDGSAAPVSGASAARAASPSSRSPGWRARWRSKRAKASAVGAQPCDDMRPLTRTMASFLRADPFLGLEYPKSDESGCYSG